MVNWEHPRDLNEKILWLICYSDTSIWTKLSDKILVRDYVKSKGYGDSLTRLYGTWENAKDIDFKKLPAKFVLKCNHDSRSVHIIDKEKGFNKGKVIKELNDCLKLKFGYIGCEPHYNKIHPAILAEEYLPLENGMESQIDYKFWCFNGHVECCFLCYDRDPVTHDAVFDNYDIRTWSPIRSSLSEKRQDQKFRIIPKPKNLSKMVEMAKCLSEGFPEVRVDLYNINGKIYFGEMTFTSATGKMDYFSEDYLIKLGDLVDLSLAPLKR
jgi:hypothetical protein